MRPAAPAEVGSPAEYVVYVEGPRDRDILCAWARRVYAPLARALGPRLVILGGRRPARAIEHFRALRARASEALGLCILDRDGGEHDPAHGSSEPGLEFFTWTRRHIESYLLVPAAIERSLRLSTHDRRVGRFFRDHLPPVDDEAAWQAVEAKRVFLPHGELARLLGGHVPPGRVARAMRVDELHPDVEELLQRLREGLGFREVETTLRRS